MGSDVCIKEAAQIISFYRPREAQGLVHQLYCIGMAIYILNGVRRLPQADYEMSRALLPLVNLFIVVIGGAIEHPTPGVCYKNR